MTRVGLVDLRDLHHRYMWDPRAIAPFLAAAAIEVSAGDAHRRSFAPPRVLIAIATWLDARALVRSRLWLAQCAHLVIVRDRRGDGGELDDDEWHDACARLPVAARFDWGDGDDAACALAVQRALDLAAALDDPPPEPPPLHRDRELPTSLWIATTSDARWIDLASIAAQLDARGDIVRLADIELAAPPTALALARVGYATRVETALHPGHVPIGFDPIHPVAWRGSRMSFYWSYLVGDEVGFLSAGDHDFPCGPAKKLWGYADNDPIQVCVTPAADLCVARFEHDALITSNVPIAWHRATSPAGELDVAAFVRDPRRALLFAQGPDGDYPHGPDVELLDEDARDLAPYIALGPDAAVRYAVDLTHAVHRIYRHADADPASADGAVVRVGGPNEGYAVFDAEHRCVRRGTGQLLGGWFRWATIAADGAYWREDLVSGERTRLAPIDFAICIDPNDEAVARDAAAVGRHDAAAQIHATHPARTIDTTRLTALAIPGTRNVLLVTAGAMRVV